MKLLFVVQRYGADITGGSEYHCRAIAQRLAGRGHEVAVATTCAADYVTWRNVLTPGVSQDGPVTVHRFQVARERPLGAFWTLSERVFDGRASEAEQQEWFALNGPDAPDLLGFLRGHGRDYDRVILFAFRYAPSWFGLPLVADRAILMPTAEDDELIRSATILGPYFASPRGFFFNTPEEKAMIARLVDRQLPPSVTIGCGVDPAGPPPSRVALDGLDIPQDFFLYVGRVDRNKGCDALVRHYGAYVDGLAPGETALPLVLAGPVVLQLPQIPGLRILGRVSDEVRDALLTHARALVMPSPYESLSLVVLEAWNRGTPVIVNARCDVLLGQVRRADGGLYYRTSDDFAGAIRRLAIDPQLAAALGQQGLAYVDRTYRWSRILNEIEQLLSSLSG